jgi:AcrR family transcriptional regulator
LERGLDEITVDDIAAAAGVSVRTFFNYFSCKEQAIVGLDPGLLAQLADRLRARPPGEGPMAALVAVLVTDAGGPEQVARQSVLRTELIRRHPSLLPRYLASLVELERALVGALAVRLGVDPEADPYPTVVVTATLNVIRSTVAWWHEHGCARPLDEVLERALRTLAVGVER